MLRVSFTFCRFVCSRRVVIVSRSKCWEHVQVVVAMHIYFYLQSQCQKDDDQTHGLMHAVHLFLVRQRPRWRRREVSAAQKSMHSRDAICGACLICLYVLLYNVLREDDVIKQQTLMCVGLRIGLSVKSDHYFYLWIFLKNKIFYTPPPPTSTSTIRATPRILWLSI